MTSLGQNHLGKEKSPYLLQHKDNPVHWYAWGDEAFEAAKTQNKPIFLSIGYSTCHWCHVMEHDSFEKQEVADVLNKYFISIKVDREERPDVDQIYMDAVMNMTGNGGWPMSVFLSPDLKPFFGGTFFWKDQFVALLQNIHKVWVEDPGKLVAAGDELVVHLKKYAPGVGPGLDQEILKKALGHFEDAFDATWGGFNRAPKFPRSTDLSLLLRIHRRSGDHEALQMVTTTLDRMARGGIYDHLGGGFHRYATDSRWLTPHFEKMLYDNALLTWTYLEAYQVTQNSMYKEVGREILDYVLSDMTNPAGGFYSAEDADSEGEEGKFYVWTEAELQALLTPAEFKKMVALYGISERGNFEHGTNILNLQDQFNWSDKSDPLVQSAHKKLFTTREGRIHPYKDDKILTDWNGLMIAAMAKGYQVLGEEKYLQAAQNAAKFIRQKLYREEQQLLRRYREGEARFAGTLSDYAYLIHGLLTLYESDFASEWITWAVQLQKIQDEKFWDAGTGGYFFAEAGSQDLFLRNKELNDGAIPSGNAVAALNLLRLHALTLKTEYHTRVETLFKVISSHVGRHPPSYAMTLIALDYALDQSKEMAIVGSSTDPATKLFLQQLRATFLPNVVYAVGEPGNHDPITILNARPQIADKPTFYVCEKNICKRPTTDVREAIRLIGEYKKLAL